jgi:DNA-directed RNA polymerase subunit beta
VPIATPVFDGAREADIVDHAAAAGFDKSGQSICMTAVPAISSSVR